MICSGRLPSLLDVPVFSNDACVDGEVDLQLPTVENAVEDGTTSSGSGDGSSNGFRKSFPPSPTNGEAAGTSLFSDRMLKPFELDDNGVAFPTLMRSQPSKGLFDRLIEDEDATLRGTDALLELLDDEVFCLFEGLFERPRVLDVENKDSSLDIRTFRGWK